MGLKQRLEKQRTIELNGVKVPVVGVEGKVVGSATRVAVIGVDPDYRTRRHWGHKDPQGAVIVDGRGVLFTPQETDWCTWVEETRGFGGGVRAVEYPAIHVRMWDANPLVVRQFKDNEKPIESPLVLYAWKRAQFVTELSQSSLLAQGKSGDLFSSLKKVPRWAWFLMAGLVAAVFLYYANPSMFHDLLHLQSGR